jgi:hypothetical protein
MMLLPQEVALKKDAINFLLPPASETHKSAIGKHQVAQRNIHALISSDGYYTFRKNEPQNGDDLQGSDRQECGGVGLW